MNDMTKADGRETRPPDQAPIVEAIGVSKRYGPTVALQRRAHPRRRRANRMRWSGATAPASRPWSAILTGLRAPDTGEIRFSGEPAPPLSDREAWRQPGRLRLPALDDHSRPHGRGEPLRQPPADASAA